MRLFLSLNLLPDVKERFYTVQKELIERTKFIPRNAIKWEDKSKFHLTLFFLGDVEQEKMENLILDLENFSAQLKFREFLLESSGIGCFPNLKKPRVIFADVKNNDDIVFDFYRQLIVPLEKNSFIPDKKFYLHITFGRVKYTGKLNIENEIQNTNFSINFSADSFYLMQSILVSTGSVYREVKKFAI